MGGSIAPKKKGKRTPFCPIFLPQFYSTNGSFIYNHMAVWKHPKAWKITKGFSCHWLWLQIVVLHINVAPLLHKWEGSFTQTKAVSYLSGSLVWPKILSYTAKIKWSLPSVLKAVRMQSDHSGQMLMPGVNSQSNIFMYIGPRILFSFKQTPNI